MGVVSVPELLLLDVRVNLLDRLGPGILAPLLPLVLFQVYHVLNIWKLNLYECFMKGL